MITSQAESGSIYGSSCSLETASTAHQKKHAIVRALEFALVVILGTRNTRNATMQREVMTQNWKTCVKGIRGIRARVQKMGEVGTKIISPNLLSDRIDTSPRNVRAMQKKALMGGRGPSESWKGFYTYLSHGRWLSAGILFRLHTRCLLPLESSFLISYTLCFSLQRLLYIDRV